MYRAEHMLKILIFLKEKCVSPFLILCLYLLTSSGADGCGQSICHPTRVSIVSSSVNWEQ